MRATFHPTTTFTRANTSLPSGRGLGLRSCKATTTSTSHSICPLARVPQPAGQSPSIGGGTSGNQHFTSGNFASKLAANGIATIGINHTGQGFGPLGALRVNMKDGSSLTIPDAGRGIDQNGDHVITNTEGSEAAGPWSWTISSRDAHRQTVIDLMQLVRVIEVGMDVDGDDVADIDPSRIHFVGASAGSMIGTVFMALEPSVPVGVAAATPGVIPEHARWQPNRRPQIGAVLQTRTPSLINSPGLTEIDGVPVAGPSFQREQAAAEPASRHQHHRRCDRDPEGFGVF